MTVAFEFLAKLGAPFFCFHDRDIAPEGATPTETAARLDAMVDEAAGHMERTGVRLLWGTANLFSHPRYAAGAATNPDPDVFAVAAAQVCHALEATHALGGANYVLWGGREGYETLLNTDLAREADQLGPLPPSGGGAQARHRLHRDPPDRTEARRADQASVRPRRRDRARLPRPLRPGGRVPAQPGGQPRHAGGPQLPPRGGHGHRRRCAGSIDANRGDPQNGWDTDQFPNSVEECSLVLYEILAAGGFTTGGINFDTKLRRQSVARDDLFHGHIGAMDTMARSLLAAVSLLESGDLARFRSERYAGWDGPSGASILDGTATLASLHERVTAEALAPVPRSGRQELLEHVVSRHVERVR